jgi:ribosomal protein S27AE
VNPLKGIISAVLPEIVQKSLRVFSPRCGVFVTQRAQRLRKGRKGFASFAKGVRLRVSRA